MLNEQQQEHKTCLAKREQQIKRMKGRQRRLKYTHTHTHIYRGDSWAQNIVWNYVITQNSQRRRQCHMSVPVPVPLSHCPSRCTRRQLAQRQVDAATAVQDTTSYKTSQGKKLRVKYLTDTKTRCSKLCCSLHLLKIPFFLLTCHRSLTAR